MISVQFDVCIILNEREPEKQNFARELEQRLSARKWSCFRLKPSRNMLEIILERKPRLLIIDYVLGDVGSAMDILAEIQNEPVSAILYTDEPSLNVAVTAIKYGAIDYIEMSSQQSLERVLLAAQAELDRLALVNSQTSAANAHNSQQHLICQSDSFKACVNEIKSLAIRPIDVFVIVGEAGAGRNTLARHYAAMRKNKTFVTEIDLEIWTDVLSSLFGNPRDPRIEPLLSYGNVVFIDHVEFDPIGELLNSVLENRQALSTNRHVGEYTTLVVGTKCRKTAMGWKKLLDIPTVEVPPLRERSADFFPLVQQFIEEAVVNSHHKVELTQTFLKELIANEWPGNIKELRAVITESVYQAVASGDNPTSHTRRKQSQGPIELPLTLAVDIKDAWEKCFFAQNALPDPLLARKTLDESLGNLRVCAAKLGTNVPLLLQMLEANTNNGKSV